MIGARGPSSRGNRPVWSANDPETAGAFQEEWTFKINDPAHQRALWLRFSILVSQNGFRRVADVWAVHFQRGAQKELTKIAVKQSYDLSSFGADGSGTIQIGDCILSDSMTKGSLQSKGNSISWDLRCVPHEKVSVEMLRGGLRRSRITKTAITTVNGDALFTGTVQINGEAQTWMQAPGMQAHQSGTKNNHSWLWSHCNVFTNEQGQAVPFVFEGLSARARWIGSLPSPRLSSFYFLYQGKSYFFDSMRDPLRIRSKSSLNEWTFHADRGDLSFRGAVKGEYKDFAGLSFEDTNGSVIYCASSRLADLSIHIYRKGKLEQALRSNGSAAFDIASRERNPYIALLI